MLEGPLSLAPYPSPEEHGRRCLELARRCHGEVVPYGQSLEGRPLLAIRVPGPGSSPPKVLCTANIHGPEYIGSMVALGLLEALADDAQPLRAQAEVWLVPCINPDGYARTWDRGGRGRLPELRPNARGVDLNRNFPLPRGHRRLHFPGTGSARPGAATYRGPHPLSEPESSALHQLLSEQHFHASANMHSFMGTLIPARVVRRKEFAAYRELCRSFRRAQRRMGYPRLASRWLDTFTGELEDHQHHGLQTWAICVETFPLLASVRQHLRAPTLFWRFNPRAPRPWVDNDVPGVMAYLHAALQRSRPGLSSGTGP